MLRIHLTAEDLLKAKFADRPAPLIEIVHAVSRVAAPAGCSIATRFWILKLARRGHLYSDDQEQNMAELPRWEPAC